MEAIPGPKSSYLQCPRSELCLDHVLATGQVFRWKKHTNSSTNQNTDTEPHNQQQPIKDGSWIGVIRHKLWLLHQTDNKIYYQHHELLDKDGVPHDKNSTCSPHEELSDYFSLKHSLSKISKEWSSDTHLMRMVEQYKGLRILRQDPLECLIAFITSSCNNIPRITSLMMKISTLSKYSLEFHGDVYYALPSVEDLSGAEVEKVLRELGFGYRAKYIASAARYLERCGGEAHAHTSGEDWLDGLREVSLEEARESLEMLAGVGPKVASCVCLMSLDKHNAVPIDTHIYQVAVAYYNASNKTLTSSMHGKLEKFFQKHHGPFAGWAQAYLFYSNMSKKRTNHDSTNHDPTKYNSVSASDDLEQPTKKETSCINIENVRVLNGFNECKASNKRSGVKKKRKPSSETGSSRKKR